MEKEKLLKLAALLECVPQGSFDMWKWGNDYRKPKPPNMEKATLQQNECGFAGCAMGWAAHVGLFDGLTLITERCLAPGVRYGRKTDFDAAAELFGITYGESHRLFYPSGKDDSPKAVAGRIREFVERIREFVENKERLDNSL